MSIQSILDHKGNKVITIAPDTKVGTAAHRLRLEHIGAVVVTSEDRRIEGILSERDIVEGLTSHGGAVIDLPVSALMSRNVHTCRPDAEIRDVMRLMTMHRIRHVPVVEGDKLIGVVSGRNALDPELEEFVSESERRKQILRERI